LRRTAGAIFLDSRPATIMRSAWRGEARNTSAPNREMSYRDAAIDIISIAQHASRASPARSKTGGPLRHLSTVSSEPGFRSQVPSVVCPGGVPAPARARRE